MKEIKTNKKMTNEEIIDSYDYLTNAASATDCTGLIPSEPMSKAERDSYEEVYMYTPPEVPIRNDDRGKSSRRNFS